MKTAAEIINTLEAFISGNKFELYKTVAPDISGADEDTIDDFNELCNDCAAELIVAVNTEKNDDDLIRKIIYRYYQKLSNEVADTEDWDFAQEIAIVLGNIMQTDMAPLFQKNIDDKRETFAEIHSLLNDAHLTAEQKIGMNLLINKIK